MHTCTRGSYLRLMTCINNIPLPLACIISTGLGLLRMLISLHPIMKNLSDQLCEGYLDWAKHPIWTFDTFSFEIIHTPGHTPCSCSFYFQSENIAFVGDTLFKGSCGRTDLPGGNSVQLKESLDY